MRIFQKRISISCFSAQIWFSLKEEALSSHFLFVNKGSDEGKSNLKDMARMQKGNEKNLNDKCTKLLNGRRLLKVILTRLGGGTVLDVFVCLCYFLLSWFTVKDWDGWRNFCFVRNTLVMCIWRKYLMSSIWYGWKNNDEICYIQKKRNTVYYELHRLKNA